MIHRTVATALALVMASAGAATGGNKIYVDMGSGPGGTGSEFSPMKTVAGGIFKLRGGNDELIIRRGLYIGSLELKNLKGHRHAPLVIRGIREKIPPEEVGQPNISPAKYAALIQADKGRDHVLAIRNCSFIRIEGLILTGAKKPGKAGVLIENSDHITLTGCDVVDNVGTQVQTKGGRRLTLENCELAGSVLEHGCRFWMSDQVVVRGCRIHHNRASGIYVHADALSDKKTGGDGLNTEVVIENNVLYANGKLKDGVVVVPRDHRGRPIRPARLRFGSAAIAGDGLERGAIRNNRIYQNSVGAIVLYRNNALRAGRQNRILHNTIYLPADSRGAYGIYLALMTQGTAIHNNVVVTAKGPAIWLGKGATRGLRSDYNVVFRLDGKAAMKREKEELSLDRWRELYRMDRNSILLRPPFVDPDNEEPAKCDFQLKKASSLGGRGQYQGDVRTDCLGRWRPRHKVTPGCFELRPLNADPTRRPQPRKPHQKPKDPPGKDPEDPIEPGPIVLPPLD